MGEGSLEKPGEHESIVADVKEAVYLLLHRLGLGRAGHLLAALVARRRVHEGRIHHVGHVPVRLLVLYELGAAVELVDCVLYQLDAVGEALLELGVAAARVLGLPADVEGGLSSVVGSVADGECSQQLVVGLGGLWEGEERVHAQLGLLGVAAQLLEPVELLRADGVRAGGWRSSSGSDGEDEEEREDVKEQGGHVCV